MSTFGPNEPRPDQPLPPAPSSGQQYGQPYPQVPYGQPQPGHPYGGGYPPAPPGSPSEQPRNTVGIVALVLAVLGFIFACIPGALIVGWVLLPAAFILSIVGLAKKGSKWQSITALILSIVGTIVGFIVFFAVVVDAVDDAVDDYSAKSRAEVGVTIDGTHLVKSDGEAALVVDVNYTNLSDDAQSYTFAATTHAFQNGLELVSAYVSDQDAPASNNSMKDIKPGRSIAIQDAFTLQDSSPVTIEITEAISLDDAVLARTEIPIDQSDYNDAAQPTYTVTIDGAHQASGYDGEPVLIVDLTFTNNGDSAEAFWFAMDIEAYQKGVELESAVLFGNQAPLTGNSDKKIKPGRSIELQETFALNASSPVKVEVSESFDDTVNATRTFKLN